jgi:hypothetical protein
MSTVRITIDMDLGDDKAGGDLTELIAVIAAGHVKATTQKQAEALGKLTQSLFGSPQKPSEGPEPRSDTRATNE